MSVSTSDSGTPFLTTTARRPVTRGWLDCRMASFWRQRKQRSLTFSLFLTVDQGIEYQQNLTGRSIAIIIFHTKSSRLKDLLPHVSVCLAHIESIQPGQIVRIEG